MTTFGECLGEKRQERQGGEWAAGLQADRAHQETVRINVLVAFWLFPSQPEEHMVLPHAHRIDTPLRVTDRHAPQSGKGCWKCKQKNSALSQNANLAFYDDETEQKEEKTVIRKG